MGCNCALEDVTLLEATSLKKGLELAWRIGCTHVLVESDASLVIDMLKTPCVHASALSAVCRDILNFSGKFQHVSFNWIPRICNNVADFITRKARIDQRDIVWIDSVPFFLSENSRKSSHKLQSMAAGRVDSISAINPTKTDWIIKVRVVRIWLMPASPSTSSYHGIEMVLCDSEIFIITPSSCVQNIFNTV
ncbi:putative DNA-directed DNA polymerase [Senna tora]|uniref:Putative DNA-directed DNA polymerase n=1 Tax=Senna tora TaxID=362788 RepID=A0A834X828_9FABA|nr:putative DNA-directed DNA polymerase [Senna tora]